jgi:hypothetical protein
MDRDLCAEVGLSRKLLASPLLTMLPAGYEIGPPRT